MNMYKYKLTRVHFSLNVQCIITALGTACVRIYIIEGPVFHSSDYANHH